MGSAEALALKLILTPVLVGAASLAGRRWGSEVGGWLVGIPFTSAPVALFLALGPGLHFAAEASVGILAGTISQAAFALAYSWSARRWGWWLCFAVATVAFAVATAVLSFLVPSALVTFVSAVVVLVIALLFMPRRERVAPNPPPLPAWDIPSRIVVATALVIALTGAAPLLGPRLAGLLAPFPLYGTVLAVFSHRSLGAAAAIGVLRGLLLGLFGFAAFFATLAVLLESRGMVIAFLAAIALALALQALSLATGRRIGIA